MGYSVKAVAALAGVSVRTLHHYDAIGLLKPAAVSAAGYRSYSEADLARLQQILFYRELDVALDAIRRLLDSPDFDRAAALRSHRQALVAKQRRLQTLIASLDRTLDSLQGGTPMATSDMFEGFEDPYREEAEARWGKARVAESHRRMGRVSKEEMARWKEEGERGKLAIAALMPRGPADPEVQAHMDALFRTINDRYYDCTPEIFRGLGEMYVADARFTAYYDRTQPGLAAFMRDAMAVYADRLEAES